MKTALVLGGGGTKGSYELGVLRALQYLEIDVDIITGTSIGSVTGALVCQNDLQALEDIWNNLSKDTVFTAFENINFEDFSFGNPNLLANVKSQMVKPAIDITPFKNLIKKYLDEDKLRNSKIEFGLVCVQFPSMKPIELKISEIPQGKVHDYLLASCSIFPAFPMCKIDDKLHIDGGYYDNVPINLAIKMGADQIIAVDLFFKPNHPEYQNCPFVKYIKTSWSLGSILSFDKNILNRNSFLGYNDTLKAYNKLVGFRYSFERIGLSAFELLSEKFAKNIFLFESKISSQRLVIKKFVAHPLSFVIKEFTTEKLSLTNYFLRGLEITLELLKFDPCEIYHVHELNQQLIDIFSEKDDYNFTELFKNILPPNAKIRGGIDTKYLIGCILYKLLSTDEYTFDLHWLATIFPKETTAAFYLYSIISKNQPF